MSAAVLMVAVMSLVLGFCKAVKDCTPVIQQRGSVPPLSGPRGTPVIQQRTSVPPLSGPRGTPVIQQRTSVPPLSGPRGKSDKRRTRGRIIIVCHLRRSALRARHRKLQINYRLSGAARCLLISWSASYPQHTHCESVIHQDNCTCCHTETDAG